MSIEDDAELGEQLAAWVKARNKYVASRHWRDEEPAHYAAIRLADRVTELLGEGDA